MPSLKKPRPVQRVRLTPSFASAGEEIETLKQRLDTLRASGDAAYLARVNQERHRRFPRVRKFLAKHNLDDAFLQNLRQELDPVYVQPYRQLDQQINALVKYRYRVADTVDMTPSRRVWSMVHKADAMSYRTYGWSKQKYARQELEQYEEKAKALGFKIHIFNDLHTFYNHHERHTDGWIDYELWVNCTPLQAEALVMLAQRDSFFHLIRSLREHQKDTTATYQLFPHMPELPELEKRNHGNRKKVAT